jgi:hypothetical protein
MLNPIIVPIGQIAAIVICLFVLIFVLLTVACNLLMAFAMGWLREQANLLKLLRPAVESINHSSALVTQGETLAADENKLIRATAAIPLKMQKADQKVERSMNAVNSAIIEVRARITQLNTIDKSFLSIPPQPPL